MQDAGSGLGVLGRLVSPLVWSPVLPSMGVHTLLKAGSFQQSVSLLRLC